MHDYYYGCDGVTWYHGRNYITITVLEWCLYCDGTIPEHEIFGGAILPLNIIDAVMVPDHTADGGLVIALSYMIRKQIRCTPPGI